MGALDIFHFTCGVMFGAGQVLIWLNWGWSVGLPMLLAGILIIVLGTKPFGRRQ